MVSKNGLPGTLKKRRADILAQWLNELERTASSARGRSSPEELRRQAGEFLEALIAAVTT